ncbi:MAG: PDZ domain-containing protein [Pyrinomonadaceae bacterium]
MFRKSFVFVSILAVACVASIAQVPEPKNEERIERKVFSMSLDSNGSYLGIQTQDVTKENFASHGLRDVKGVVIEEVSDGSPAQTAGLQKGDVIVSFNGEDVTSVRKLSRLVGEVAPDHKAVLTIIRGGSESQITATIGKRKMGPMFENAVGKAFEYPRFPAPEMPLALPGEPGLHMWTTGANRQIGISVIEIDKQLAEFFGATEGRGLLVNSVREGSPASKAGFTAGDVIVDADGKAVKNDFDLIRAINEKREGPITVTIIRGRSRQTMAVTPETVKRDLAPRLDELKTDAPDGPVIKSYRMLAPQPLMRMRRIL